MKETQFNQKWNKLKAANPTMDDTQIEEMYQTELHQAANEDEENEE
ncbi:MAG: hypothetical protein ACTSUP_08100 [Candidatus Heimdallarchaeaceae archaeon]